MLEHIYQQFYPAFLGPYVNQEQTLKFHHFLEQELSIISYQSGTYFITKDNFLTACFFVLRCSGTNLSISGFFIIVPILNF